MKQCVYERLGAACPSLPPQARWIVSFLSRVRDERRAEWAASLPPSCHAQGSLSFHIHLGAW